MSPTDAMMRVRKSTLAKLKELGKMGETYNDVVDRLIEHEAERKKII